MQQNLSTQAFFGFRTQLYLVIRERIKFEANFDSLLSHSDGERLHRNQGENMNCGVTFDVVSGVF